MSLMVQERIDKERQLEDSVASFHSDPLGFVMFAYPWGEPGTVLEEETGPDPWQEQILSDLGHAIKYGWVMNNGAKIDCSMGIFIAVASGHGIGKSALMAWLDQWFTSTHPHNQSVTTANTKDQLTTKTWREMAKWHKLLINRHWFKWTATRFICRGNESTWFSSAIPWSDQKPESFAGTHEKFVLVKYDEASAISDIIWETTEGAMTESKGIKIWITFGNPTQPTGRFTWAFGKDRNRWITYNVDSRDSKRTDKKLIQYWINLYGEDSDFVRIRVKGMFPRAGAKQFISLESVQKARGKVIHPGAYYQMPKILGVDIARFGDDQTVLIKRQGLASYGLQKYRGLDSLKIAGYIAEEIKSWQPDAVFLDMGNIGAAIYDILRGWEYNVTGVWFGSAADDQILYYNKRVEMWGKMKDWLDAGGSIPDDQELEDDLVGPQYGFTYKEQFQLESKEDMRRRDVQSPDCGDALAVTFAYPVAKASDKLHSKRHQPGSALTDYDILTHTQPKPDSIREPERRIAGRALTEYDVFGRKN